MVDRDTDVNLALPKRDRRQLPTRDDKFWKRKQSTSNCLREMSAPDWSIVITAVFICRPLSSSHEGACC